MMQVLFKMSSDGDGTLIDLDELNKVKTVALESFTMEKFRHMCILSGCDYLPSVKGLGLYKAHKYLKRSTNVYKVNIYNRIVFIVGLVRFVILSKHGQYHW